ncbi:ATP-binding protein [Streptacidiphilus melanogenes]|uniref:ATP-binding protein n=1 Tax=Streptacidiphilus melanogenes TaxID=411235 RepID=UPI0005AB1056|nr:helix-turn-helix domain-containing protein [Streptacidiphilus melanogenes]
MRFGSALREARLKRGWTQEELAAQSGVSTHAISVLEAGRRRPRLSSVSRLAQALGLDDAAREHLVDAARAQVPAAAAGRAPDARTPAPHRSGSGGAVFQLPGDTRMFTGRVAEVDRLVALARRSRGAGRSRAVVISAINGMGGVGKSALAVHVAHRLKDRFPDGQLFLDLRGHTPGTEPLSPLDALGHLLRSLGTAPQQIPADLGARASLYRDRLAGTRSLVLLDNAAGSAQVRPLLPGEPDCLVLVTSRKRLSGLDDAHSLPLDTLSEAEACELLHEAAGSGRLEAEDPAVRELAGLCGRLPLAVRITGARLRHRPVLRAEDLVAELRDERRRLERLEDEDRGLTAVFDSSYEALPQTERRLLRLLGLVPGDDFDPLAAANLLGTDERTAARLLESLLDHNLLAQHAVGRYHFHDLVHLYARGLLDEPALTPENDAARERLLDYYTFTAREADGALAHYARPSRRSAGKPPSAAGRPLDRNGALEWMRAERSNLLAAVAGASGRRAAVLTAALSAYLYLDGSWALAAPLHEAAAAAARDCGNRSAEAAALCELSRIRHAMGEYPGSVEAGERSLAAFRELEDRHGEAEVLWDLGRTEYVLGNYPAASARIEDALDRFHRLGDGRGEAGTLNDLGRVRMLTGEYAAAGELHERALRICQELGDQSGVATALRDLGRARYSNGDPVAAVDLLGRSLLILREIGSRIGEASSLHDLGHVHHETGRHEEAAVLYEQALTIFQQIGNRQGEANSLWNLGRTRQEAGDYASATDLYDRARVIHEATGNRHGVAATLRESGHAHHLAGDLATAEALYTQALPLLREIGSRPGEITQLTLMGALALDTTGPEAARAHYQEALGLARLTGSSVESARALEGSARAAAMLGQRAEALHDLREAVSLYRSAEAPEAASAAVLLSEWETAPAPEPLRT